MTNPTLHGQQNLRTYLEKLDTAGKLWRIDRSICKDTELMPLVRWQFRGLPESQRRGFLFTNVHDAKGIYPTIFYRIFRT